MKFPRQGKKEEGSPSPACASCGMPGKGMSQEDMIKKLREMEKNKAKPTDCPYLETCETQVLSPQYHAICVDEEPKGMEGMQSQSYMVHMASHHMWESCYKYIERKQKEEGKLPRDWKKELKK